MIAEGCSSLGLLLPPYGSARGMLKGKCRERLQSVRRLRRRLNVQSYGRGEGARIRLSFHEPLHRSQLLSHYPIS